MAKERQDVTGSNCLKDETGKVVVDGNRIKDTRKKYTENMMNEENNWDHEISCSVKEEPEVIAVLKKMKKHKSPRLIRASSRKDTSHREYWNSVANSSMQWYRKSGIGIG